MDKGHLWRAFGAMPGLTRKQSRLLVVRIFRWRMRKSCDQPTILPRGYGMCPLICRTIPFTFGTLTVAVLIVHETPFSISLTWTASKAYDSRMNGCA